MKLISAHINGFGMYVDQDINFDSNFISFVKENGQGKTTLINFIKAMLYGLDSIKENDKEFKDRRHYNPFNSSSSFGGNLILQSNNDTYRIERSFDVKSERRDTCKIYKNNNEYHSVNIGEELFGIDKNSFSRLLIITSDEIEIKSSESINKKLFALLKGNYDDSSFEAAIEKINEKINIYGTTRSSKDKLISNSKDKINSLINQIKNLEEIQKSLNNKYVQLSSYNKQIEELKNKISKNNEYLLKKEKVESYKTYKKDIDDCSMNIEEIKKRYLNGIPTKQDLDLVKNLEIENKNLKNNIQNLNLDEIDKLKQFKHIFKKVLSEDEIDSIEKVYKQFKEDENNYNTKINELDNLKNENDYLLKNYFKPLTTEDSEKLDKCILELTNVNSSNHINKKDYKLNILFSVLLAVFLILCAVGIYFIFNNFTIGLTITIIGGALSIICILLFILFKKNSKNSNEYLNKKIQDAKNNAINILKDYNYQLKREHILLDINDFKAEIKQYESIKKEVENRQSILNDLKQNLDDLSKKLNDIFNMYCYININLNDFIKQAKEYLILHNKNNEIVAKNTKNNAKIEENNKKIDKLNKQYNLDFVLNFEEISNDVNKFEQLKVLKEQNIKRFNEFKKENNLNDEDVANFKLFNVEDSNLLIDQLKDLNLKKDKLTENINNDESETSQLNDLKNQLEIENENLQQYQKNVYLLDLTKQILTQSNDALLQKYVAPIKDKFTKYSDLLKKSIFKNISFTKDFNINIDINGKIKNEKYLSSGEKAICAFCFRLALIENMYEIEKPFILLDDPFTFLDESNFNKISDIVKTLSLDMQIVYLTCHSARKI